MAADKPSRLQRLSPLLLRLARLAENPVLRLVGALLIAGVVLFILHKMSAKIHWRDVKAALAAASPLSLGLAVLAMATSFVALALYDVLAVRALAPGRVPARWAALAGAGGYAVSNLLGASYLTGTAVRYRVYARYGLDLGTVVGIIATSWSAFWTAALLILGGLMVFHPQGLSAILPISAGAELALGLALLAGLAAFLTWLGLGQRAVTVAGSRYALPDLNLALGLMAVAVFDLGGASMTLYAVMPVDAVSNITLYLTVYVGAVTLGILSHAPGGIGVFEATMIAGLGASGRSDVVAALLIYRMIYSVLPFALASLAMAGVWLAQNRQAAQRGLR